MIPTSSVHEIISKDYFFIGICIIFALLFFIKLLKNVSYTKPVRGFQRIAGMETIKEQINKEVVFPYYHMNEYKKFNLSLPNGILFYGPTGCGKTFFVECLAEELNMNFIKISQADISSPYIHETVSNIACVFEQARKNVPCLVFFDEIEGLLPSRYNISSASPYKHEEINEFLLHLDNASNDGLLVIGATNHIEMIDPAVQRSGRFDLKIYISPPDDDARKDLFYNSLKDIPHSPLIDYTLLSNLTVNYTSADIVNIVKSAARSAVINSEKQITQEMLENSIREHPSSLRMDEVL